MGEPKLKIVRTREDHLRDLEQSERKFELVDGQYFAMAGSRFNHGQIITNVKGYSFANFNGSGCFISSENLTVHPPMAANSFIPDVVIHCPGERPPNDQIARNPLAIFEVLSPGREDYDRVFKWSQYRRIPALRHYVLISQEEMRVEHRFRPDESDHWATETLLRPEDRLTFAEVPFDLSLAQIYARIPLD